VDPLPSAHADEKQSVAVVTHGDAASIEERKGSVHEGDATPQSEDPSPHESTPSAKVDAVFRGIASAETDSVADRVTVDVGLFMHFVDSYSISGDNLKRITLSNEIEHAIGNFHPYHFPHSRIKTIVFGS
ncbi:hypothetical protein FOZ62_020757, partial [Perkinsus olseni]